MASQELDEKAIFNVARQIPSPAARAEYLQQVCGENAELLQRMRTLLQGYEEQTSFLEFSPAGRVTPTQALAPLEKTGIQIGPYKLMEQIGEGGMGLVFVAEQHEPVRRKVAIKVIKPGMDTRDVMARFEAERQALALMDHPNIAKVFDAGASASGRPYFVMELVKGVPITQYCDDNRLSPRERLELFTHVCHAVQHAHHKGVIHRDIKPNNVLVASHDGRPEVKVIDFGVAKAIGQQLTERTIYTAMTQMVGTPLYMSPEQAGMSGLDIDTRTDIYSLGVLLYELLTGTTPFDKERLKQAAYDEMRRIIREEEPQKPSTRINTADAAPSIAACRLTEPAKLAKLVRGDLDWIVMKALEKDRSRRYETPNGIAADVLHYLNDETVQACPPSAGYRLRKFVRRNRAAVLSAAAVLFVLVVGIAGTTFGLIRADHRRMEAEQARADEAAHRQIADAEKRKAEQAEADTLADYRASTDDAIEQLIGSKPDLGPQEKTYLEKTLKRWQAFAARQGDHDRSQAIRAEGHHRVALLWAKLGQGDVARTDFEAARDLYKKLADDFPAVPDYRHELARTHVNLGLVLASLGQREAARTEYETARDLQKELVAAFPAVAEYQQKLAVTHSNLGTLLRNLGQREAARTEYETAQYLRQKLADDFPAVPAYQEGLARTHDNLGALLAGLGQREAARTEYEMARDLLKKLADDFPAVSQYHHGLATTHIRLGNLLFELGQGEAARTDFETARDLYKKLADAFPAMPGYQRELAITHNNLGNVLLELGQRDAVRTEYETARELQKKLADDFPAVPDYQQQLATFHNNLGNLLKDLGQGDAARTEYETARDLQKKLVNDFPAVPAYRQELARTHNNLGSLLEDLGQGDAARTEYETARDLQKKLADDIPAVPEYQVDLGGIYANLGNLIRDEGRPADSLHWYNLTISTLTPVYEKDPRAVRAKRFLLASHLNRAKAYGELKNHSEAAKDWHKALELDPKNADAQTNLSSAYYSLAWKLTNCSDLKLRDPKRALVLARLAVQLAPKNDMYWRGLGYAEYRSGNWKAAVDAFQKVKDLGSAGDSLEWFPLSMASWQLGDKEAARDIYDQAVQWMEKHKPEDGFLLGLQAEAAKLMGIELKKE